MKKETIIVIIALLAIVAAVGFYYWSGQAPKIMQPQAKLTPEQQADKAGNPFSVNVNPYDGYTNPFAK